MPDCISCSRAFKRFFKSKQNVQIALTIGGVLSGIALGFGLRPAQLDPDQVRWIALPGTLFLRSLKVMVLPVVVSSIVCGFANLKGASKGKLLLRALAFYLSTTAFASITGVLLSLAIKPGVGVQTINATDDSQQLARQPASASDAIYDLLMNMFPDNMVKAAMYKFVTMRKPMSDKLLNMTTGNSSVIWRKSVAEAGSLDGSNYIGVIVLSMVCGCLLNSIGKEGRVIASLAQGVFKLSSRIILMLMWVAPVGLAFLIAPNIIKVPNFEGTMAKLGKYILTVLLGFVLHYCVTLSLIYFAVVRKNPFKFAAGMTQAVLTMFGTASSSATLPVTMRCCEENNKVDPRVTGFVLPIGATINMDGTALYQALSAIFIAQLSGIQTNFGSLITISLTASAASIGTAGVPMSSIVNIMMVLQACNLPTDKWYLLLSVDWILGRLQGIVNILSDGIGSAVIARMSRDDLNEQSEQTQFPDGEAEKERLTSIKDDESSV